jgi:hypothetical protein
MQYHRFGYLLTSDADVVPEPYRRFMFGRSDGRILRIDGDGSVAKSSPFLIDSGPLFILRPWSELTDDPVTSKRHDAAISEMRCTRCSTQTKDHPSVLRWQQKVEL